MRWVVVGVLLLVAVPASAWDDEIDRSCRALGVHPSIVHAMIEVESGGNPYVLNARLGTTWVAYYPTSRAVADVLLRVLLTQTTWIDVGLMQIHVRIWAPQLDLLPRLLLDPQVNVRVGCMILAHYLNGRGPLWQRIGRYHSRTPGRNEAYAQKILAHALAWHTNRSSFETKETQRHVTR